MGMTFYEEAKVTASSVSENAWKLGWQLMRSIEAEGRTIREFCIDLHGTADKEDTYGRYVQANRFAHMIDGWPDLEDLSRLELTFYAEAWKGYEAGWDIEDLLDTMVMAAREKKSVRWFRAKRAEATGTSPLPYHQYRRIVTTADALLAAITANENSRGFATSSADLTRAEHASALIVEVSHLKRELSNVRNLAELMASFELEHGAIK